MTADPKYQALFLGAGPQMQCGVGQFTRLLYETIEKLDPGCSTALTLTRSEGSIAELWHAVGSAESVVCNFPIVAWKRVIARPLLVLTFARLRRRRVVLIQHEWMGLHWLRRLTYVPALLLADTIITFSPLVRSELAENPLIGWTSKKCVLAPLPPNIGVPPEGAESLLKQRLAAARAEGRVIIGHFGSIYPAKRPDALLGICAILKQRGVRLLAVYIGSFIRAVDTVEEDFYTRVATLDLSEEVLVSGYVESDRGVFGLFELVDAFCYPLEEGITARRSSVLASVQSGRPVIVSGPADAREFDHHPRFQTLIENGAVVLVPRGSDDDVYADKIIASLKQPTTFPPFDFDGWWHDTADAIKAQL